MAYGRVSDLKDGLPDDIGSTERSGRAITLENVFGNCLMLDHGHRQFALYAPLQPGSLKVKVGDKVNGGQVLALLGSSGNSDAPHLHFHLIDSNSPMGAEGIPYEIRVLHSAWLGRRSGCCAWCELPTIHMEPRFALLLAQRLHRIYAARPTRGYKTREERGNDEDRDRDGECRCLRGAHSLYQAIQDTPRSQGRNYANTNSDENHHKALSEYQPHDISSGRPKRHAYADFRYALAGQVGQYAINADARQ